MTNNGMPLVEQELLTLLERLSSLLDFSGVRVTIFLVLCVCFVDRCLSFCPFVCHVLIQALCHVFIQALCHVFIQAVCHVLFFISFPLISYCLTLIEGRSQSLVTMPESRHDTLLESGHDTPPESGHDTLPESRHDTMPE
jgi:hypothetical protein